VSAFYPKGLQGLLDGSINLEADTIRIALTRATYNSAHDNLDDVAAVTTSAAGLTSKTFTDGVFDAADDTFGVVAAGAAIPAVVLYKHTGTASTSRLIFYADDYTGLPVVPDGTNAIPISWPTNGIFALIG
jgi:hypothetical protein